MGGISFDVGFSKKIMGFKNVHFRIRLSVLKWARSEIDGKLVPI